MVLEYSVLGHMWIYHDSCMQFYNMAATTWSHHTQELSHPAATPSPNFTQHFFFYHFVLDFGAVAMSTDLGRMQTLKKALFPNPQSPPEANKETESRM